MDKIRSESGVFSVRLVVAVGIAGMAGSVAGHAFGWVRASIGVAMVAAGFLVVRAALGKTRGGSAAAIPEADVPEVEREAPSAPEERIDAVTGLANLRGLEAWFSEKAALLAAEGKSLVVLSAKLADADALAAQRGRAVADDILREVAARASAVAGSDGIAARTGGDEFAAVAAVVPGRAHAVAAERAGHLVEMIGRPVEHPSGAVWIGGNVGAATGRVSEHRAVLDRAREALRDAERLGRGHFVVLDEAK